MLLIRKPEPKTIRDFIDSQSKLELSYSAVGATATNYTLNVTYIPSGRWMRCEDRMRNCCDGTGAISACP